MRKYSLLGVVEDTAKDWRELINKRVGLVESVSLSVVISTNLTAETFAWFKQARIVCARKEGEI